MPDAGVAELVPHEGVAELMPKEKELVSKGREAECDRVRGHKGGSRGSSKGEAILSDFEIGQAVFTPYQLHVDSGELFGNELAVSWFGKALADSLKSPTDAAVSLTVEARSRYKKVVILNCIDFIFGHSLLKLLNAQKEHEECDKDTGIAVIVQAPLRWLVPNFVAEVWTVDIPFAKAKQYYLQLDEALHKEIERFEEVSLSQVHSHPSQFDIENFTRVQRHTFDITDYRIAYIWRNHRGWGGSKIKAYEKAIIKLFTHLRETLPKAQYTVAGFGSGNPLPTWIDDQRLDQSNDEAERKLCEIYAQCRLIIGPHGSNMLLPSAHAGMTIDLMPSERWSNMTQDILYQECFEHQHTAITSYRYRFLPETLKPKEVAKIAGDMLRIFPYFLCHTLHHGKYET